MGRFVIGVRDVGESELLGELPSSDLMSSDLTEPSTGGSSVLTFSLNCGWRGAIWSDMLPDEARPQVLRPGRGIVM